MSSATAEQKVKKLARLPGNIICANCATSKKFGFSTVCIKFFTFVCNDCKSSHQAISHRCKSLTMSSWTDAEVAELEAKGNDYARRTWLQKAPPVGTGGRPKEGDSVDVFKRFVVDVYERRRYHGEDTGTPPVAAPQEYSYVATAVPTPPPLAASAAAASRQRAMPPLPARAPAPAPPDLLDLSSAFSAPVSVPAPASFRADYDAFASTPVAPPDQPATPFQEDSSGSAFGFLSAPPAAVPVPAPIQSPNVASSGFSFLSKPPAAAQAPAPSTSFAADFADFAGMTISSSTTTSPAAPTQPVATKKPVMSLPGTSQKASMISSMDSAPSIGFGGTMPQQQPAGFAGMGVNNGMGINMNNMSQQQIMMIQQQQQRMMMMQQQQHAMAVNMNMGMGMGGINMNSHGMAMNPGMSGGMNSSMGIAMMTPQQMMNFGSAAGQPNLGNQNNIKNQNAMNGLSLSGMDINAWTTGKK